MSVANLQDEARDVKGFRDSPLLRLVDALRAEGEHDDVRIGCAVLRVYSWAHAHEVVAAVLAGEARELPAGWRRGMFAGRRAEEAVRAAGRGK